MLGLMSLAMFLVMVDAVVLPANWHGHKFVKRWCKCQHFGWKMRINKNDLPERYQKQVDDQLAVSVANVEQGACHASFPKKKITGLDAPCSIHIHSKRKKLTDADGVCAKYVIDGLVHAGLFPDDSPKYVKEVRFSQEKSEVEETIITIETVKKE